MRQLALGVILVLLGGLLVPYVAAGADADESPAPASTQNPAPAEGAASSAEPSSAPSPSPEAGPSPSAPPATPSPTFDADLPKRGTPDAPLFIGPTTTKISGKRGTYKWTDVRFGADEVSARVAVVPERSSCLAQLKLIGSDATIAEEWFSADAGEKETHDVTLEVDYAKVKLRVDSDCRSWSVVLKPLEDPELPYTVREKTYTVKGDTIDELIDETQHIDGRWAAYTEWFTSWAYSTEEAEVEDVAAEDADAECMVTHGDVVLATTITYPKWKRPKGVDPDVVAEWERFMEALRVHEEGHVTISLQGADAIDDRLDKGFSAPTCEKAWKRAGDKATEILERYNDKNAKYDEETDHGASQGAALG